MSRNKKLQTAVIVYLIVLLFAFNSGIGGKISPLDILLLLVLLVIIYENNGLNKYLVYLVVILTYLSVIDIYNGVIWGSYLSRVREWLYFLIIISFAYVVSANHSNNIRDRGVKRLLYLMPLSFAVIYYLAAKNSTIYSLVASTSSDYNRIYTSLGHPFFIFIIYAVYKIKIRANVLLWVIIPYLFILTLNFSRMYSLSFFGVVFILLLLPRFRSFNVLRILTIAVGFAIFILIVMSIENEYLIERFNEIINLRASSGFIGRYEQTLQTFTHLFSNTSTLLFGGGLSGRYEVIITPMIFNKFTGEVKYLYNNPQFHNFHSGDNIFSLLAMDGGILLLSIMLYVAFYTAKKLYHADKYIFLAYSYLLIMLGAFSTHIVSMPALTFTLSFIYFSTTVEHGRG